MNNLQYSKFRSINNLFKSSLVLRMASSLSESNENVTFESLNFDNLALRSLPIDPIKENYVREVPNSCFSKVKPTPLSHPKLVVYSEFAMGLLDLTKDQLERPDLVQYFSGNKLLPGSETAAHCYCGHQFGSFSGQLGDGAAIYLGEIVNKKGERWEIQLKGAGKTPYSRSADGRKVLRSSLREFLCSEAMHNLGIPTTRAGTCITSESTVIRDIMYDGNPILEKCTVILRISPTFIRFGSFEICKDEDPLTGRRGPSVGKYDILKTLLNYVIKTFYPEIAKDVTENDEESWKKAYLKFYEEIVKRTARLVAEWQCVGWCHGVLNTDNMSIIGVTIDYGPFGFLDKYNPNHICNGSDTGGRYSYKNQPEICKWNCQKLAEALQKFIPLDQSKAILESFNTEYDKHYLTKMRKKLGLFKEIDGDDKLVEEFLETMYNTGADFTNSFRNLNKLKLPSENEASFNESIEHIIDIMITFGCSADELRDLSQPMFPKPTLLKLAQMIPEQQQILYYMGFSPSLIVAELEKLEKYEKLENLSNEDKLKADRNVWKEWLTKYISRVKLEYKDENMEEYHMKRVEIMNSNNPRFILRNHIVQNAIEKAEKDDFSEARALLKLLENPYSEEPVEKLIDHKQHGKCSVDWKKKAEFYESKPTPDMAKLIVT